MPATEAHYAAGETSALSIRCLRNLVHLVKETRAQVRATWLILPGFRVTHTLPLTHAKIVVSSTWRLYPGMLEHLKQCIILEGGQALRKALVRDRLLQQ